MSGYLQMSDGRIAPVRDGLVLGRVSACDVLVDDPKASRRHARVVVEAGVVEIEDLQSSNGTLLNGHPVSRRVLRDGDCVRIGKTEIVYREGAVPGGSATVAAAPAHRPDTDDVDLFGETTLNAPAPTPAKPPPAPPAPPAPSRPAAPPSTAPVASPASAAPPPSRPAAPSTPLAPSRPAAPPLSAPVASPAPPAPAPRVVEFADEVVEVRQPAKTEATRPAAAGAEPIVKSQRILQYSKQSGGGRGLLGDDISQLSGGTRSLVYAGVLVVAAAIVWGIVTLVR